jgi:TPR repeat protein
MNRRTTTTLRASRALLAIALCCQFATAALAASPLEDGLAAYERKDFERAVALLRPLAEGGSARAQLQLGRMYYFGQGVKEDDTAAFQWYRRAALQGNAEAQLQLAGLYLYGQGWPAGEDDPDVEAAKWYFAAARQGNAEAQYHLGLLFSVGKGVQQKRDEATKWMKRAAAQGHEQARLFLEAYARR